MTGGDYSFDVTCGKHKSIHLALLKQTFNSWSCLHHPNNPPSQTLPITKADFLIWKSWSVPLG